VALINIEQLIEREDIKGKYRLNRILSLRAREIIEEKEGTLPPQVECGTKPTTKAIFELVKNKVKIEEIEEADE